MIETERLKLLPLTPGQLRTYCRLNNLLERELGINPHPREIDDELKDALENTLIPAVSDPSVNYLFSTLWTVISKTQNVMVGDLCFKGEPNAHGEVEIGYGTYPEFQNRGYMTEAVKGILVWVFDQKGVDCVLAETEGDNVASHQILVKNRFQQFMQPDGKMWWRLEKKMRH